MTGKIENPFKYGEDPELNAIFDRLIALKARVANEFAKAEKIAGFTADTGFKPIVNGKISLPSYTSMYENNGWTRPSMAVIEKKIREAIKEAREYVDDIKQQNISIEEHNKKICDQVTQIMDRLGVPKTYTTYEYPTSRSRIKKSVSHTAGYVGDLARACPQSNVSSMEYQITSYERDFETWMKKILENEKKLKIEKDTETVNKKILGKPDLVATLLQAGVNILQEVQNAVPGEKANVIEYCMAQAFQNTIERDKYLKLVYHLKNSEKFGSSSVALTHAKEALSSFAVDSNVPEDAEIYSRIDQVISNWNSVNGAYAFRDGHSKWHISSISALIKDTAARDQLEKLSVLYEEI